MGSCRPYRRIGTSFAVTLGLVIGEPLSGGNTIGRGRGDGEPPPPRHGPGPSPPGGGSTSGLAGRGPRIGPGPLLELRRRARLFEPLLRLLGLLLREARLHRLGGAVDE